MLIFSGVLLAAIAAPGGLAIWNAAADNHRLDRSIQGTTRVRVWAAGIRTNPDGTFCGCSGVAKPERMLYETTDPGEIRRLASSFRAAPHLSAPKIYSTCGILTIDFLGEDRLLASFHIMDTLLRSTFRSWWDMEMTSGSSERLQEWLGQRGLVEKLEAASPGFPKPVPTK